MTQEEAFATAIQIVGGKSRLAREIGVSPQRLDHWTKCHPEFVLAVEGAVARAVQRNKRGVSRFDLRPDLYPKGQS